MLFTSYDVSFSQFVVSSLVLASASGVTRLFDLAAGLPVIRFLVSLNAADNIVCDMCDILKFKNCMLHANLKTGRCVEQ